MKDLEAEFESLIQDVYKSLQEKHANTEITYEEFLELAAMVKEKTGITNGWESSMTYCYQGDDDDEDGWNRSMIC